MTEARKKYFKMIAGGIVVASIVIFGIFSILWGAFYRTPVTNLEGWIIDFDGGRVGQNVVAGLTAPGLPSKITWNTLATTRFPNGVKDVSRAVLEDKTWIAVTINPGTSSALDAALTTPNATYDGSQAISVFGVEARNENVFRNLLRPSVEGPMAAISAHFAAQLAQSISDSPALPQLLAIAPQTVTAPISYKIINLCPFDQPIASVATFVGLMFLLILSFLVVMIGYSAREVTNLERLLTYRSLVFLRFSTVFMLYFLLSLFYSLLSLAFHLDVSRRFGHSGFAIFWMLNLCSMCAVGLAMEAMLSLLSVNGVPFFLLIWIMVNVSPIVFPIEVLPVFYRYGYAIPLYNVSRALRIIVFSTKNRLGFHFGVLLIWAAISCITLPLFQYLARRRDITATKREQARGRECIVES
ncbi:hypothetical protein P691DRAFT_677928 [Macrolepiota fuliginosa MF-IS2]|uniref:DUF3533 domain-containing protein n=1 Tax=Macrolepiota fuliginosa MF-IS2 TaxID=1400762 RepID=A0A9P6BYI3_9AGAR|nr:hypothetical protein P691DRAFT_677928 [Macrolepiota fuliginosa MF-IS2]